MLVELPRKAADSVFIGKNIEVTILKIDKDTGTVHLRIEAPEELPIHRREVHDIIQVEEAKRLEEESQNDSAAV